MLGGLIGSQKQNLPASLLPTNCRGICATLSGSPAILVGRYGEGRVLCFGPHPEQTQGLEELVLRAVGWTTKRDAAER